MTEKIRDMALQKLRDELDAIERALQAQADEEGCSEVMVVLKVELWNRWGADCG